MELDSKSFVATMLEEIDRELLIPEVRIYGFVYIRAKEIYKINDKYCVFSNGDFISASYTLQEATEQAIQDITYELKQLAVKKSPK